MIRPSRLVAAALLVSLVSWHVSAQDRKTKVLNDRDTFEKNDLWLYNDLEKAFAAAKKSNKPLLVVFRCVPCEACSHFDKQLLDEQESMRELLDQFVCARVVQANGLDLELFQFDYDQSFHAMFLNADKTIYGRFGTRSQKQEDDDMTMAGFRKSLERVVALHKEYPKNKQALAGKRGGKVPYAVPESFPSLKGKYKSEIDYQGNVVASCIHCHQVREGERIAELGKGKGLPEKLLYPYPLPEVIGLTMDPNECGTVKAVAKNSLFAEALQPGDQILALNGQPIVSPADIQWVLHNLEAEGALELKAKGSDGISHSQVVLPKVGAPPPISPGAPPLGICAVWPPAACGSRI